MKVVYNVVRINPNQIEEIVQDDVASVQIDDTNITIKFNNSPDEIIPLRANNGVDIHEWSGLSMFMTRVGLKLE